MTQICISSLLPKKEIELYGNQAKLRRSRFPLFWKLISERSLNVLIKIHPLATKLSNTLNHLLSRRQKISPVPVQMVGGQVPSNNQNL